MLNGGGEMLNAPRSQAMTVIAFRPPWPYQGHGPFRSSMYGNQRSSALERCFDQGYYATEEYGEAM